VDEPANTPRRRVWLKRIGITLGVLLLVFVVLHRPILQTVVRRAAIHFAAKENLALDLRVEGSILGGVELRNVRAVATGPSALQSADVDLVRVDYSLAGLIGGGVAEFLNNVEVRGANVVLDPARAPPKIDEPKKDQQFTVPAFFPDRLVLDDVNVRIIGQPNDMVLQGLHLSLLPDAPGELRIARLQLANGRTWQNVAASTSYAERNLMLRDLVLDDQTNLRVVNIDASAVTEGALSVRVEGTVAGAAIATDIALGEQEQALGAEMNLVAENVSLDALTRYLDPPDVEGADVDGPEIELNTDGPAMRGDVRRVEIRGRGQLERPRTWTGTVNAQVENIAAGGAVFDAANVDIIAADGVATIRALNLRSGDNTIDIRGTAELPETTAEFGRAPANVELRAVAPDLSTMTAGLPTPVTGSAEVNGRVSIRDAVVHADLSIAAGPLDAGPASVQRIVVNVRASKQMPPPGEERPYFYGLTSEIGVDASSVTANDFMVDAVAATIHTRGQQVTIEQVVLNRSDNRIAARGEYLLPVDLSRAANQPAAISFSLDAPQVGDYWATAVDPNRVTGALQASGQVDWREGLGAGSFQVYGSGIQARNLTVHELSASGTTAANTVYLNDLTAALNERDYIRATGTFGIEAPHPYSGAINVSIANLSTFEPVLRATGNQAALAGTLDVRWHGDGTVQNFRNTGSLALRLDDGRFGDFRDLEARVDASYTPEALNVPIVFLSSDRLMLQAVAQTRGQHLEISKIEIMQDKSRYGGGYISVPFVWENLGTDRPVLPPDGEVIIGLESSNLDLARLARDFGQEVPIAGSANVKLDASGTLQNLRATFDLQLTGLRSEQLQGFTPATFGLRARVENNQLLVDGRLEQARIAPVEIRAQLPFNVPRIVEERGLPDSTPVSGSVRMAPSNTNFIRQFVPAILTADGTMAINVDLGGTIGRPVLSGSTEISLNVVRFTNPSLPAVTGFAGRIAFAGDTVTLQQFRGEMAGGPFTVTGRIVLPKLTEPVFDLQLRADAALVARNDNLTARADANLRVTGPLASAAVTGDVALTNSRFLKNIDLIPIGLPGRPAPRPKPPPTQEAISLPPPLSGWTFDIGVTTKDPFLIRGNLANGGAIVNMRLTGTGAEPALTGMVRLRDVEATLPFSRLTIDQGFLYFDPGEPLNPRLELQGTSLIRDYTIRVFVYGTANAPEAVFTSQPPLPQEEIISLLATGTTREELVSGGNVLAGRAAILLFQQLYRSIFKRGEPEGGQGDSIFDRLDLDIGQVDPRTGQQSATARYRINRRWMVIGTVGVEGDFRGVVRYVLQFR
jgi:hypothetical protein